MLVFSQYVKKVLLFEWPVKVQNLSGQQKLSGGQQFTVILLTRQTVTGSVLSVRL